MGVANGLSLPCPPFAFIKRDPALSCHFRSGVHQIEVEMAEIAPIKADIAAAIPPDLISGPVTSAPPVALAATKKKAAYRPQKGAAAAVAEQILDAVAATKERQVAKLGAVKKTSAASCRTDKVGAWPNKSNKSAPSEDGTDTSAATLSERVKELRGAECEPGQGKVRNKRNTKKKAPARKMGPRTAAQRRAKKPAAKSPIKRKAAKKGSKRPASSAVGQQRRVVRKR
ncbi:histone H1-like [Leucoraja erinacea]|uniref:histone H1-like n=1 Tax=Leucoraja erinaceus TaxID=7782 RepID=UPI0024571D4E|nr:histone H1-like [Leucoraja erinacea]